jgi:4,5-DOPA dioxygenase extradiol
MIQMPTLFVSHGGPNVVTDPSEARDYLKSLSGLLPRPRSIVIVSAHFETDGVVVVTDPAPDMIYDFRGFAPGLYQMVYPAPGDPALAARVVELLDRAGLAPCTLGKRGYDHGAWTPMLLAFPAADIPIVQVSIDPSRDADWHYRLGRALAPLREEGVLLVGSGHITHNLRAFMAVMRQGATPDPELVRKVDEFTSWFADRIAAGDVEALLDWKNRAPYPAENHPTDEHLMPIFLALGAAGDGPRGERIHASKHLGFFAYDSYLFQ